MDSKDFLIKNNKVLFVSLFIFSFFPVAFDKILSIKPFMWIDALAPIALYYLYIKLTMNKKKFFPSGSRLIIIAMFVLGLWGIIHYISNPLTPSYISENAHGSGFRRYYEIFIGICVFFYFFWSSCHQKEEGQFWKHIITIIMLLSLFLGYLRAITYFLDLKIPLLAGHFDYGGQNINTGAYRIGGLTEMATIGISALIAVYYKKQWTINFFILLCLFTILLILSGGRTATFAVLIIFIFYVNFIEKDKKGKAFLLSIFFISIILILDLKFNFFTDQFMRLTSIKSGLSVSSPQRYELFKEMWKIFINHPIIGKGIGVQYINWHFSNFAYENLIDGGHGSYLSIIMLFGIGGAFFLITTLFYSIFLSYTYLKKIRTIIAFEDECIVICFCLVLLCMLSIIFISEGGGYNNLELYVLSGIIAGKFSSNTTHQKIAQ